jgi:hypothetical protein
MSKPADKLTDLWKSGDWRITMGISLTGVWLLLGIIYLTGSGVSARTIFDIPLENIGSFLEGAFAPLAFLWLVIGLFVQQKELSDNTEVLRLTLEHAAAQTEAIAATAVTAKQDTFFKIAENVKRQLGGISALLFASSMSAGEEDSVIDEETIREMFHALSIGDSDIFMREFMIMDPEPHGGYPELFYGTEIRRRHAENFIHTFERLIALAKECDTDGLIADSLTQTAAGIFYDRLRENDPKLSPPSSAG